MLNLPKLILIAFCLSCCVVNMAQGQIQFPKEGRWSIATAWQSGWPTNWVHVQPSKSYQQGEWTMFEASADLGFGVMTFRDAERTIDAKTGLRQIQRRWHWQGPNAIDTLTLSFRIVADEATNGKPFLPGISYYDNLAGQSVNSERIPVIQAAESNRKGFYEEHRFPLPFAAVERSMGDDISIAALHAIPSPVVGGNLPDQWWSLGIEYKDASTELAAYSGAVASNGKNAIIKGHQKKWHPYDRAWMTMKPDGVVEKTFFIETATVERKGSGFQVPLWTAIELSDPLSPDGFPKLKDVIRRKFADTLNRWREGPGYAGIQAFPGDRKWIDLAWAGQSEAFAYPMLQIGTKFTVPNCVNHVQQGLDFISTSPFNDQAFSVRFDFGKVEWLDRRNPLSQGQTMKNMLSALRLAQQRPEFDTSHWQSFLKKASDHHANRILQKDWRPPSTNEGFLIAPLAMAAALWNDENYRAAAIKAGEHYAQRHLTMVEPYWGGTLDARCEDKEGAWAALQGFLALYDLTRDEKYIDWAQHAGDIVLSYVYVWDVPLPAGRLTDHAFKTRGWTSVSVQNMHLDVYGVLCAPAFWKLGELTGRQEYQQLARLMIVSCGQLLDPFGSQGEQIQQTNYAQHRRDYKDLAGIRGDYVESWNVYWISAHFLVAVSELDEMEVDWMNW